MPRFRNISSESSPSGATWSVLKGSPQLGQSQASGITPSRLTGGGTGPSGSATLTERAIYIVHSEGSVETVYVEEVNKHDY